MHNDLQLVDIHSLRPKNETYEHFILKQISRAWLFKNGVKNTGCEVLVRGKDISPNGRKSIVDVAGVKIIRVDCKKHIHAQKVMKKETMNRFNKDLFQMMNGDEADRKKIEDLSNELGLGEYYSRRFRIIKVKEFVSYGVEVKVSRGDFKQGYSVSSDYSYVCTPVGLISPKELPKEVGLLEVDLDLFQETGEWEGAIRVKKKPRKRIDSSYILQVDGKSYFDKEKHQEEMSRILLEASQKSTQENIFWNPHLRNVKNPQKMYNSVENSPFRLKLAESTEVGIVIDCKLSRKTSRERDLEMKFKIYNHWGDMDYYKFVVPDEGITKWISYLDFLRLKAEKRAQL